jgi:hypothetical protein
MGMDVFGKNPTSEQGEYFRSNVWYWHPLWSFCEENYPEICSKVKHGHSNSGDGLNKVDSIRLSELLLRDLENGFIQKSINDYEQELRAIPLEDCEHCDATGERSWPQEDGTSLVKQCNVCQGQKKVKPFATWYRMDLDLIKEFQQFLRDCGGFRIC